MFDRIEDQELFEETTKRFLESEAPVTKVRDLVTSTLGYEESYWRRGAELGWTSLLVPEEAGGGSVSAWGVLDLIVLAFQFGFHAAPGPLLPVNVVAAALGRWGSAEQHSEVLSRLLDGSAIASWATSGQVGKARTIEHVRAHTEGEVIVVDGEVWPIEAGSQSNNFLVTAYHDGGLSHLLIPSGLSGVIVRPLNSLDLTRRFARLELDGVHVKSSALVGRAGMAAKADSWLKDLAVVVQLAEIVGAMQWAFETTLAWASNRYTFGRPLNSYQALKHRFADMKMFLESSYAITQKAAMAVQSSAPDQAELVSAGKFYVGRYGPELMHDCVQMHGGIGVTFDHDLHIFLRRVATNVPLYGSPSDHAARLATLLESANAD